MKKSQHGFGVIGGLLIFVIVGVIGFAGWYVWQNNRPNQTKKQDASSDNGTQNTSAKVAVITKEDLIGISLDAPQCGSEAMLSQTPPKELELNYTKPEGWLTLFTYPNGVAYKSPDFESEQGFKNISKGASLILSTETTCTSGNGLAADMESWAQNRMIPSDTQLTFLKIADYYGVRFSYNSGENHNNHDVVLLFKIDTNRMHTIEEEYSYSAANPYPDIIDQVLKSVK